MSKNNNTTQKFVDIADIRGGVVILKDGSLRAIIKCSSINFSLKSQVEQEAIIQSYHGFINSIDFPLQIVISSRKLDPTAYLERVNEATKEIDTELLKIQANDYIKLIKELTELNNIVTKDFYIVVPYYLTEISFAQTTFKEKLKNIFKRKSVIKTLSDNELEKYVGQLEQRVTLISFGIEQLGVRTSIVHDQELIDLYSQYYNPINI